MSWSPRPRRATAPARSSAHASGPRPATPPPADRLAALLREREERCRLLPELALASLDEAGAFLRDRGMLTRTADCALPSLFAACHEPPYRAGRGGFAEWPATKYPWFWELASRDGVYEARIHRGKSILLTATAAALADPLCRAELERVGSAGGDAARLLDHLAGAGPSTVDDLVLELGWERRRLRSVRIPLERVGAVVSHGTTEPGAAGGHLHTSVLARWDDVVPPSPAGGLAELVAAGVRAAVVTPEADLARWFPWRPEASLVDGLVAERVLERPAPGWIAMGGA